MYIVYVYVPYACVYVCQLLAMCDIIKRRLALISALVFIDLVPESANVCMYMGMFRCMRVNVTLNVCAQRCTLFL